MNLKQKKKKKKKKKIEFENLRIFFIIVIQPLHPILNLIKVQKCCKLTQLAKKERMFTEQADHVVSALV